MWDNMEDIIEIVSSLYTNEYGLDLISVLPFAFLLWLYLMVKNRKQEILYKILLTLITIYIAKVIDYTILPLPLNSQSLHEYQRIFSFDLSTNINLIPFILEIGDPFASSIFRLHFLNILLFVPMGMIVGFCYNKLNLKQALLKVFYISLLIETVQLFLAMFLNFSVRTFDINDLIMNTFGGLVGILIFRILVVKGFRFIFKGKSIYDIKS